MARNYLDAQSGSWLSRVMGFLSAGVATPVSSTDPLPVTIAGGASATQYTEDAAAAADPVGNIVTLVRKDTPAATVTTDGDNIAQRGNNFGAGYVEILDSAGAHLDYTAAAPVVGAAAHGAAISGAPVRQGGRAATANPAAVTDGQTVDQLSTLVGARIQKPYSIPEADLSYAAAAGGISNTTTAVTIAAAAGSGLRNYITSLQLNAGTLGAATEVAIRNGAAGTVIWRGYLSTAGGNISAHLPNPIKSSANTLLEVVTLSATVTGAVYVNAQGYIAP